MKSKYSIGEIIKVKINDFINGISFKDGKITKVTENDDKFEYEVYMKGWPLTSGVPENMITHQQEQYEKWNIKHI